MGGQGGARGRAVQIDPIKPTLKVPGTERLKLKYDKPLSSLLQVFASNFKLRRYTAGGGDSSTAGLRVVGPPRCCPPRPPTLLNPRFLSETASYDVASNVCQARCCPPRQPTLLNPRFLSYAASCDVAINVCRALADGVDDHCGKAVDVAPSNPR